MGEDDILPCLCVIATFGGEWDGVVASDSRLPMITCLSLLHASKSTGAPLRDWLHDVILHDWLHGVVVRCSLSGHDDKGVPIRCN